MDFVIQCRAKLYFVHQFLGQHDAVKIAMGAADAEQLLEGFHVIPIITQFPGCLHEEGDVGSILGEVIG